MKQTQLLWAIMCEKSMIDSESNNMSLHNIIETLRLTSENINVDQAQLEKGVAVPITYEIVALWQKTVEAEKVVRFDAKIDLVDPQGKVLQELAHEIEIQPGIERFRWRVKANAFAVTVPGEYVFKIYARTKDEEEFDHQGDAHVHVKMSVPRNPGPKED